MEAFMTKYNYSPAIYSLFKEAGVRENHFFVLNNENICSILSGQACLINFIANFNYEKGAFLSTCKFNDDAMIQVKFHEINKKEPEHQVASSMNAQEDVFDSSMSHVNLDLLPSLYNSSSQNPGTSQDLQNPGISQDSGNSDPLQDSFISQDSSMLSVHLDSSDDFCFRENNLFHLLNKDLEGRVLLAKYKYEKILDRSTLKHKLIYNELSKDLIFYKIKTHAFKYLTSQIVELFPTEDPQIYYIESGTTDDGQVIGARGCLYNYYKEVRSALRAARLLTRQTIRKAASEQNNSTEDKIDNLDYIRQYDSTNSNITDLTAQWESSYEERLNILSKKEKSKKVPSLRTYFQSFPAFLRHPYGVILLENDFMKFVEDLKNKSIISTDSLNAYTSMFSVLWPDIAKKIIAYSKKVKVQEVKQFLSTHEDLIEAGTHDSILALFLMPYYIRANKSYKVKNEPVNLTKKQMFDCFILHVEDSTKTNATQKSFEEWLVNANQQVHPYLLCVGKIKNLKTYIVLNNEKYYYENPIKATEACYKCLTALRAFPHFCDFAWNFIDRCIYNFTFKRINLNVSKLHVDIETYYTKQAK